MKNYLNELVRRHRRLNRQIDNRKAAGWQVDMKQLKRLRLRIKDEIQTIRKRLQQSPS
ncbi:YdcH family protein [Parasphingorhabdus sp.]|uniref:YdcH family protein n=1 Tax=Parasphingorhabdus sp. TaxID=2709688 RepID=UPI0030031CB1